MIVTENEAITKWCPMARATVLGPDRTTLVDNRPNFSGIGDYLRCVGSNCMWWVWIDLKKTSGYCAGSKMI